MSLESEWEQGYGLLEYTSAQHLTPETTPNASDREQAQEGQYIRRKEEEALKAARDKLAKAQAEVDAQQKKVDSIPQDK